MAEREMTLTVAPWAEAPRETEADDFRNGLGFHPANTTRIQLAHEAVRLLAQLMGTHLVMLLPNGRDKSLAKTHLEDVMMRANRAVALGKGPHPAVDETALADLIADLKLVLVHLGASAPEDPRLDAYKAEQRAEQPSSEPNPLQAVAPFKYRRDYGNPEHYVKLEMGLTGVARGEPEVKISIVERNEAGEVTDGAALFIDEPVVLEEIAAYQLARAAQLRALKAL